MNHVNRRRYYGYGTESSALFAGWQAMNG